MIKRKLKNKFMTKKEFVETWLSIHSLAKKAGMYNKEADKTDFEAFMKEAKADMRDKEAFEEIEVKDDGLTSKREVKSLIVSKLEDKKSNPKLEVLKGEKKRDVRTIGVSEKNTLNTSVEKICPVEIESEKTCSDVKDMTTVSEKAEVKSLRDECKPVVDSKAFEPTVELPSKEEERLDDSVALKEKINSAINKEEDFFKRGRAEIFDIEVSYTSPSSEFNGIKLLEKEVKDGIMQIGFYSGEAEITSKKVQQRKRKTKEESDLGEQNIQIAFI